MGLFKNQLANIIVWEEFREDMIFWKWNNEEIKKGSKLILRPGQDAIFIKSGKIEGIFKDDGEYDIESDILPFLSTLSGFKFGFNSGMRAEVLFINTKLFTVRWGTTNPINIPAQNMPGGIPIRANGTFCFKINDYILLIDKIAGIKKDYFVNDVKEKIISILNQLLMKWIVREGKDMFNLQANAFDISKGIREDLDREISTDGMSVTDFNINSFSYPQEIQEMINKNASNSMVGDVARYTQINMADAISSGHVRGSQTAADMAGMMMGLNMTGQMMNNINQSMRSPEQNTAAPGNTQNDNRVRNGSTKPNFCPNCGQKTDNGNFCSNCGQKLN